MHELVSRYEHASVPHDMLNRNYERMEEQFQYFSPYRLRTHRVEKKLLNFEISETMLKLVFWGQELAGEVLRIEIDLGTWVMEKILDYPRLSVSI